MQTEMEKEEIIATLNKKTASKLIRKYSDIPNFKDITLFDNLGFVCIKSGDRGGILLSYSYDNALFWEGNFDCYGDSSQVDWIEVLGLLSKDEIRWIRQNC